MAGRSYTPEILYIASIYPGQLESIRRNYGPTRESVGRHAQRSTLFRLEPVARGKKPFVLDVVDSFEDVLNVMQLNSNSAQGSKQKAQMPVPAETIVADILSIWTGGLHNVPADAKPGVMQIINKEPTAEELREMVAMQTRYFEFNFAEGEKHDKQSEWKEITDTMRLAADWLGHKRAWSHKAIAADSGPCPLCTEMIPNSAIVCPRCRMVVRAMPADLAKLNAAGGSQGPQGVRQ